MRVLVLIFTVLVASCDIGGGGIIGDDDTANGPFGRAGNQFAPGTWELTARLQQVGQSQSTEPITDTVDLTAEQAAYPAAIVFFTHFYHGQSSGDVQFANGRIEGSYESRGVDGISAQTIPVRGTYASDQFAVTFEFAPHGTGVNQIVEGRLISPE